MITAKFYLDTRRSDIGVLKISITLNRKMAYIPIGVKISERNWDSRLFRVVKHPNKDELNMYITQRKNEIDSLIYKYNIQHIRFNTPFEVKARIEADINGINSDTGSFYTAFKTFADLKIKDSTRKLYLFSLKRISDFDDKVKHKRFEDITQEWLLSFKKYMSQTSTSVNGINVHLRNIRTVFNYAIDEKITEFYPFRRFPITPVETAKRDLSIEELRTLLNYPVEPYLQRYVDIFFLNFYLIGINMTDLCHAMPSDIRNGRLMYERDKTGRHYSIKIEPEASDILDRYKGKEYLLNILDDYKDYHDFLQRMNKNLKRIGPVTLLPHGKKVIEPLFPKLSTYWARHTWATLAHTLGVSKDIIALALGHGKRDVTDTYIHYDIRKIDEANRLVIDWLWSK